MSKRARYLRIKRAIDAIVASLALVLLLPLLLFVSLLILLTLGQPVLFTQVRPGLNEVPFRLYKFRTMRNKSSDKGLQSNAERMTRFGRIMRSTSIDELPSLWNIVRGDMSFVGPRPLRLSYLERYSAEQRKRHHVSPGLTGLAQSSGRNSIGWDDRIELDLRYVAEQSFFLDASILLRTAFSVVRRDGIVSEGEATMSEFYGPERTSRLALIELKEEHLPKRVEWLLDPRIRSGLSISFTPELSAMRRWFAAATANRQRLDLVTVERDSGHPVSMCGLNFTSDDSASLYVYVDPDRHGQGFGDETMSLLISRARRCGVRRLWLETPLENIRARHMYTKFGFEPAGVIENRDKLRMQKLLSIGHQND